MENLAKLLTRLHDAKIQFVLIGGLAAVRYGTSYVTYDVDICVPLDPSNFQGTAAAIADLHPRFRQRKDLPFELTDELVAGLKNLDLLTDFGALDCLGEVAGVGDYNSVLRNSNPVEFPFGTCNVLKLETLIAAKEAIGRPQDMLVVAQLRAIKEKLDMTKGGN
jgi:hypothetical protein